MLKTPIPAPTWLLLLLAGALPVLIAAPAPALAQTTPPAHAATARPHHAHRARHLRAAPALSALPPAPPALASAGTTPAPVPNEGLTPPPDHQSPSASLAPSVFQLHYPPQGDGYVTGSSPQAMDDRNAAKATGVQATVPLSQ